MTGVRQMIAVIITFKKYNINSLERRAEACRSCGENNTLYILWAKRRTLNVKADGIHNYNWTSITQGLKDLHSRGLSPNCEDTSKTTYFVHS
jgi:hypothetical protein